MKRLFVAIVGIAFAIALTATAQDAGKKKHEMTDEQKAVQKEMLAKYDANKDGKLDKEEKAKMTQDDKDKWNKAFPKKEKKDDTKKDDAKADAPK